MLSTTLMGWGEEHCSLLLCFSLSILNDMLRWLFNTLMDNNGMECGRRCEMMNHEDIGGRPGTGRNMAQC